MYYTMFLVCMALIDSPISFSTISSDLSSSSSTLCTSELTSIGCSQVTMQISTLTSASTVPTEANAMPTTSEATVNTRKTALSSSESTAILGTNAMPTTSQSIENRRTNSMAATSHSILCTKITAIRTPESTASTSKNAKPATSEMPAAAGMNATSTTSESIINTGANAMPASSELTAATKLTTMPPTIESTSTSGKNIRLTTSESTINNGTNAMSATSKSTVTNGTNAMLTTSETTASTLTSSIPTSELIATTDKNAVPISFESTVTTSMSSMVTTSESTATAGKDEITRFESIVITGTTAMPTSYEWRVTNRTNAIPTSESTVTNGTNAITTLSESTVTNGTNVITTLSESTVTTVMNAMPITSDSTSTTGTNGIPTESEWIVTATTTAMPTLSESIVKTETNTMQTTCESTATTRMSAMPSTSESTLTYRSTAMLITLGLTVTNRTTAMPITTELTVTNVTNAKRTTSGSTVTNRTTAIPVMSGSTVTTVTNVIPSTSKSTASTRTNAIQSASEWIESATTNAMPRISESIVITGTTIMPKTSESTVATATNAMQTASEWTATTEMTAMPTTSESTLTYRTTAMLLTSGLTVTNRTTAMTIASESTVTTLSNITPTMCRSIVTNKTTAKPETSELKVTTVSNVMSSKSESTSSTRTSTMPRISDSIVTTGTTAMPTSKSTVITKPNTMPTSESTVATGMTAVPITSGSTVANKTTAMPAMSGSTVTYRTTAVPTMSESTLTYRTTVMPTTYRSTLVKRTTAMPTTSESTATIGTTVMPTTSESTATIGTTVMPTMYESIEATEMTAMLTTPGSTPVTGTNAMPTTSTTTVLVPNSPLCSKLTAISNTSVRAYWRDGGNASDFRIHIVEQNRYINISKSVACISEDCSIDINELSPGTNYNITVFAISNGIENNQSCYLHGSALPNSPLCSILTAVSNASLRAQWLDGGNATAFRIHIDEEVFDINISRNATCLNMSQECSYTIPELSPGTNYSIKIFAISNVSENGQPCNLSGTTMPSPPLCSHLKALNTSSLGAYWYDGGNSTDFRIHIYELNIDTTISKNEICFNSSKECNHTIYDLTAGRKYRINISALAFGIENIRSCSLTGSAIPSNPLDCSVVEITAHNFSVTWKNGIGDRDFYKVNYICLSPNKLNETFENSTDLQPEEYIYKSIYLDPGTDCTLQIYAVVKEIETLSIPLICNLSTYETAPGSVENLKLFNISSTSMGISWTPPSRRNGLIRGYLLTVIEDTGYCVKVQSCVQHYDLNIHPKPENYSCQEIKESIELKECLFNGTVSHRGPFLLKNLKPHANYSIWLRAYTVCLGDKLGLNAMTLSTAPYEPSNINAKAISSQQILVTWNSPALCTGITSYSIIFTDAYSKMETLIDSCSKWRKEFELTECTIEGLEEYWQYTISVQADVDGFSPSVSRSVNETTLESTPGPVETIELEPEQDTTRPRSMLVKWKPPRPREKNGVILSYKITYYFNLSNVVEISLASNVSQKLLEYLTAEKIYFVKISASTSKGYGVIVQRNATMPSGAPEHPRIPLLKSTAELSDPARQIAVDLPLSSFLCNAEFGLPERWGVVVSQYSKATDDPFRGNVSDFLVKLKSYRSWRDIRNEDNFPPYRATHDDWNPVAACGKSQRRKRSTETANGYNFGSFIIGQDRDCTDTGHHFCNGYLKPNTEYSVRVYVCTSNGCTESVWSSSIATDDDNTVKVIVLSVVLSLLVLSGISCIIILRMRRRMCFKMDTIVDPGLMFSARKGTKRPLRLSTLASHVEEMHKDSNIGFSSEYKLLKNIEPQHTADIAESEPCRSKNRYTNILPYDHSRVKLLPIDDEEGSDYINANYIQGYNSKREYIAAQGPLPATSDDFWRMVWEHCAEIIVMLTKCVEKGRVKCDKYWPEPNEPVYYGDLIVNVTSESVLSDYIIKVIEIKLNQVTRRVYHFSFLNWPDMGCPKDPASLLNFVTSVRTYVKPDVQSPIIVHCSAGVGRTGTFIAIDHLMQVVKDSDEIDILNLVYMMRHQRCNMVQTEDQYVYIHDSILEYVTQSNDDGINDDTDTDDNNVFENTTFNRV